jgi:hypothetical protein
VYIYGDEGPQGQGGMARCVPAGGGSQCVGRGAMTGPQGQRDCHSVPPRQQMTPPQGQRGMHIMATQRVQPTGSTRWPSSSVPRCVAMIGDSHRRGLIRQRGGEPRRADPGGAVRELPRVAHAGPVQPPSL